MNDTELRGRLRTLTAPATGTTDLKRVERRARTLRLRRGVATAIAASLGVAAIAVPLSGLRHLGEEPASSPTPPAAPAIRFAPLEGWTSTMGSSPAFTPYSEPAIAAMTSNVTLAPADPGSVYPPGLTNNQIDALPADGIAIEAKQMLFTRNDIPTADYPILDLPLDLDEANSWTGGGEGLSRSDLTQYYLRGSVNGRPIIVQAWFGTSDPRTQLLSDAQRALNQLVVSPAPTRTDAIDDFGISMTVPEEWHALLYQGDPTLIVSTGPISNLYWDETRKTLGPSDVTLTLDESDALVELEGWPALVGPLMIGPYERCDGCEALDDGAPPRAGHVLYERTFTTGGRAFTLLVEFGSEPSPSGIDEVNGLLSTLAIQTLPNPTETPAPGTVRVGPIYDGGDKPEVTADQLDRELTWAYEHAAMTLPKAWTGQSYPVAGLERPISLLAAGSWDFTPGGYCGPINALRELPADGALVWFDGYGTDPPEGITFISRPSSVSLTGAATDPSPCFGGSAPFVFRWTIADRYVVAYAALGADASSETVHDVEKALESISVG
jgi:hypothetical protein